MDGFYAPAMAASVSLPMFMMGGVARPLIGKALGVCEWLPFLAQDLATTTIRYR
ncbi:MAG: hypothetical protein CM1200mP41_01920 [Gammaproteobacteria bacterium]|nr:MAG: hypothetical protein CM1200mP41_01920 [Gammaproteobacteria bacterium]